MAQLGLGAVRTRIAAAASQGAKVVRIRRRRMDADDPSSTLFRAWEELAVAQATIQVMQHLV